MSILRKVVSKRASVILITLALLLVTCRHWGMPWGWYYSNGISYGETSHGPNWLKMERVYQSTPLEAGDNVGYRRGLWSFFVKRIVDVSPDGQWFWVMGDNQGQDGNGLMNSSGSYVVGWLCRPGATSAPPDWPRPDRRTAPRRPLVVRCKAVALWAPFDRRSEFEMQTRFFNPPESVFVSKKQLILVGKSRSEVFERSTGKKLRPIPGKVTQVEGSLARFLQPTAFPREFLPSLFNLENGSWTLLEKVPQIAPPQPGEVDMRKATLIESSGQNPAGAFDRNPKTAWYIGIECRPHETLTIKLPKPTLVKSVVIDGQYRFGTRLTVAADLQGRPVLVEENLTVNRTVDTITLTLTQGARQPPFTGQVKEVEIIEG